MISTSLPGPEASANSEAPKKKERKKSPYLTFVDVKERFPTLFAADAAEKVGFGTTNTAVDAWFKTSSKSLVDPSALPKIVGRAFWLQHRTPVNPRRISAQLNGSAEKPVQLRQLSKLVSKVVGELIKGPLERPERELRDTGRENPSFRGMGFREESRLGENEMPTRDTIIFSVNSLEYVSSDARGRISPLKGTAPDKAKGTEEKIRAKVFTAMRGDYPVDEVDDDMLRSCIIAAWDQLSGSGSYYEGNKKTGKTSGTKPLNLSSRKG